MVPRTVIRRIINQIAIPLDLIEGNLILPSVVELGRPRVLVVRDVLRDFELAAVFQIRGDAGRPAIPGPA